MTKVNNTTAESIIENHGDYRDLVLVSIAGDWLLLTRDELKKLLPEAPKGRHC